MYLAKVYVNFRLQLYVSMALMQIEIWKLKLGHKWVFQMDNDPKHTSKVVAKWLKDNKVKVLDWPSQSVDLKPIENVWAELIKRVRARRPTNLTQLHHVCRNGLKFTQLIVGSLWKANQNI